MKGGSHSINVTTGETRHIAVARVHWKDTKWHDVSFVGESLPGALRQIADGLESLDGLQPFLDRLAEVKREKQETRKKRPAA